MRGRGGMWASVSLFNVLCYCIFKCILNISSVVPRPPKFDSTNSLFGNTHQFLSCYNNLAKLLLMIDSFNCLFIDTSAVCNRNLKVLETCFIPSLLKQESHIRKEVF